jgi:hemolysin activation/secretion protein
MQGLRAGIRSLYLSRVSCPIAIALLTIGQLTIGWAHPTRAQAPPAAPKMIAVQRFQVIGNTVFRPWELANVTQPYEDQTIGLDQLQKAADAVTRYYLDHGYLTSRAVLADQEIANGIVKIQVIEGNLAAIEIEGSKHVDPSYVRDRLMRTQRQPLNQESLENSLRLLKADPLFQNVEAALREGNSLGNSILNVRLADAKTRLASIGVDNYNSPSVGATSLTVALGSRNSSGYGDLFLANYARSTTGGSVKTNFLYQHLLNSMQGTLEFRVSPNQFRITQPDLQDFDINGRSDLYEVNLRQPIVREPNEEIALGLGVVHRRGVTVIGDFLSNANQSTTLRFSQDLLKRDYGGMWTASSQLNLGLISSENPDGKTASPFITWTGQIQRLQFLGKNNAIAAALSWQVPGSALPPTQQFSLGGAQSLRGYPYGAFTADGGMLFSIEQQLVIQRNAKGQSLVKLSPFIDLGTFWHHPEHRNAQNQPRLFSSAGIGVTWQPLKNWSLQIDLALPLRAIEPKTKRAPAIYFNSNFNF